MRFAWLAWSCAALAGGAGCSGSETDGPGSAGAGGYGSGGAAACYDDCIADHPQGAVLFQDLADCLICVECYHSCGEVPDCAPPDAPPDGGTGAESCDAKNVCSDGDSNPDNDCTSCALASKCKDVYDACQLATECITFGQCIESCPDP